MTLLCRTPIGQPDCTSPIVQAALSFGSLRRTACRCQPSFNNQPANLASLALLSFRVVSVSLLPLLLLRSSISFFFLVPQLIIIACGCPFSFLILFFLLLCLFATTRQVRLKLRLSKLERLAKKKKRVATRFENQFKTRYTLILILDCFIWSKSRLSADSRLR